jgi:hypothetical protein
MARLEKIIGAMTPEQFGRVEHFVFGMPNDLSEREYAERLEAWLNGEAACDDAAEQRDEQTDLRIGG